MASSVGFRLSVSLHPAIQVTGLWLLPRRVCLPLNTSAFSGRTVDDQLEGGRLLHGQVSRFGVLEDFIDVDGGAPKQGWHVRAIGQQASSSAYDLNVDTAGSRLVAAKSTIRF
jgi:hypothetical protein